MDSNLLTNKIISVVVALVVALCVLVPIADSYGGESNSGSSDEVLTDMMSLYYKSIYFNSFDSILPNTSTTSYGVIFHPADDDYSYQEGEIVALLVALARDALDVSGGYTVLEVTHTHGKLHVVSSDPSIIPSNDYVAMSIFTNYYNPSPVVQFYKNESDIPINITIPTAESYGARTAGGYLKYVGDEDDDYVVHITKNPNLTLDWDNMIDTLNGFSMHEPRQFNALIGACWNTFSYDINDFESGLNIIELEGEEYIIPDDLRPELDAYLPNVSLKSIMATIEIMTTDITPEEIEELKSEIKYLIFNKHFDYTLEGDSSGGNGNSDTGITGTLVQMIPLFVILGILLSVVTLMTGRSKDSDLI